MSDHKAEAEVRAHLVGGVTWEEAPHIEVALAQVHATLYLAEQQRIANLIALGLGTSSLQIREALGLS